MTSVAFKKLLEAKAIQKATRDDVVAPYFPSPDVVIEKMVEVAEVSQDDVVYDIGSGDGRMVIFAARKHRCRAIGIEIDRFMCATADSNTPEELKNLIEFRNEDARFASLKDATVMLLYMGDYGLAAIGENIEKQVKQHQELNDSNKKRLRIVSHEYKLRFCNSSPEPESTFTIESKDEHGYPFSATIYLYRF